MAAESVAGQHLVVIGASAGGVEALRELVAELSGDCPAAVLVVVMEVVGSGAEPSA
jgi:two-component system chemotaxis response regulator CheB